MNVETFTELIPTLKHIAVYVIAFAFFLPVFRMIACAISEGASNSLLDCILERVGDLMECITSVFHKSDEKMYNDFLYGEPRTGMSKSAIEWDNGFFNSDVYSSDNRTDG